MAPAGSSRKDEPSEQDSDANPRSTLDLMADLILAVLSE